MKKPRLLIKNLSFSFPGEEKLLWENLNFSLEPGQVLGITGPSGCGKTTLCYCLGGIIPRHLPGTIGGAVLINNQPLENLPLPRLAQEVGVVFQDPETQLFCTSVEEEIAFGPENICLSPVEINRRISEVLAIIGMSRYRFHNPARLSGGEQQLIALGAVLALRPHTLILDEAMSQLDQEGRQRVLEIAGRLKNDGKTLVLVDHNLENLALADHILHLDNGRVSWS